MKRMLDAISFGLSTVALGPLLITQGRYVRRITPVLDSPRGRRWGGAGERAALRLLVAGDSAAEGVGAATWDETLLSQTVRSLAASQAVAWRLVARTGATTAGLLGHLRKRRAEPFDVAVLSLGVNDVTAGRPIGVWRRQQRAVYRVLRERFGVRQLIVSGLPPMAKFPALPQPLRWYLGRRARQFDGALVQLAEAEGCDYLHFDFDAEVEEMASDGFHPGAGIYAKWGAAVARRIEAIV